MLVLWCPDAKKAMAFPTNSFSFSNSRTHRRNAVISASISRGSGRPCSAAWRLSRSILTHRPITVSPSPTSRATDAIDDPVSNTRVATSRRYSCVKRRRVPIKAPHSPQAHTRFTKFNTSLSPVALTLRRPIPRRHPHHHTHHDMVGYGHQPLHRRNTNHQRPGHHQRNNRPLPPQPPPRLKHRHLGRKTRPLNCHQATHAPRTTARNAQDSTQRGHASTDARPRAPQRHGAAAKHTRITASNAHAHQTRSACRQSNGCPSP